MNAEELRQILHNDVVRAAQTVVGSTLVFRELRARIVEAEAYGPDDPASHSFRGVTPCNATMFGIPGIAYVYRSYGCHWMLNIVALDRNIGAAVLIRAAEPLAGLEEMRSRRRGAQNAELLSGPGKLTQAFAITHEQDGIDLLNPASELRIEPADQNVPNLVSGPRIGIAIGKGHETPYRFADGDQLRWVSSPRRNLL